MDEQPLWKTDDRTTDELIAAALAEEDEERYWEIVEVFRPRGTRDVFEAAEKLCHSENGEERALGADILRFLGLYFVGYQAVWPFQDETVALLLELLPQESDPDALSAELNSIRQFRDPRVVPEVILPYAEHPEPGVRLSVTYALGDSLWNIDATRDGITPHRPAIEALIKLSTDEDGDVRDWATFQLSGESMAEVNWPEITEALWNRVYDEDPEIRSEALRGLACRKAPGVVDALIKELSWQLTQEEITDWALEGAAAVADPRLCPVLRQFEEAFDSDRVGEALKSCGCSEVASD